MRFIWTFQKLQAEALKYKFKNEFQKGSKSATNAAYRLKVMDEICAHMPDHQDMSGENHPNFKWAFKLLQEEALKYQNRNDFQEYGNDAYQSAHHQKVLDEICQHMDESATAPWTDKELKEVALKYDNVGDFIKNDFDAYKVILRHKGKEKFCSHMKFSSNSSKPEKLLFDVIKDVFPTARKFVDNKVKINKRPYIRGFEIDILIPELNLGIEFDGTYWHSFEGLKRSHPKWPDSAIRKYHQIKDAWFATKGITILHIKGEDWKKDPENCIDECLVFLESNKCA